MRLPMPAIVLLPLAACATVPPGAAADPPARAIQGRSAGGARTADTTTARLAAALPDLLERAGIPGLAFALVRDGRVEGTGVAGVRDAASDAPVTDRTVFQAASLSKPVFATIVLRLASRGVLDLDRPLATYRPNPRMAHDPRYLRITPRMILSHSSGLPNWGGDTLELAFEPGTAFRYSGEGYVYLQEVVEERTGLGLDALARREIFEPLGMTRTSYVWEERFEDDAAVGHDALGRPLPLPRADRPNAAASLLTTAGDYGRFVAAFLAGRLLDPAVRARMLAPAVGAESLPWTDVVDPRIRWGLGWGLEVGPPDPSIWHWGDNGAFKAFVAAFPERDVAVVYFANSVHGLSVAEEVVERATGVRHGGQRWAGYPRYDAPPVVARRELFRAFEEGGVEAGLARFDELRARSPDVADAALAADVAGSLADGEREAEAVALLERARAVVVDSESIEAALGEAYLRAGRYAEAEAVYRGLAGAAAGEEAEGYGARADWVALRLSADREPISLPLAQLQALTGRYGPRRITLDDGSLYYQRDDRPRYRLVPLSGDTFRLDGLETFRIRFHGETGEIPTGIVGLYFDGGRDTTPRDPGGG